MANNWNITNKDAGIIGGVARGTAAELTARLDKLDAFYNENIAKIQAKYRSTFISAKAVRTVKEEPVEEPTKTKG